MAMHRYCLRTLIVIVLIHNACISTTEASFSAVLNNFKQHGNVKGKLQEALEVLDGQVQGTLGKISVLAAYFGDGISRRDLSLPQIFTEIFSRKNAISVNSPNGKAWVSKDGTIIAAVSNGGTVSISSNAGTVAVIAGGSRDSETSDSGTSDNSTPSFSNEETNKEDIFHIGDLESGWNESSNVSEVEDLLATPFPGLHPVYSTPVEQINSNDATTELMSDWNKFITSSIWDSQDVPDRTRALKGGMKGSMKKTTRIVRGISIANHMASGAPFSVRFFYDNEKMFYCSGSLIGYPYVLTAAHCGVQVDDDVRLGGSELRTGLRATVSAVTKHPAFDARTLAHDIAVIRLKGLPERKILLWYGVQAARLNKAHTFPKQGFIGVVSAHGAIDTDGHEISNRLRSTRQRAYNYDKCATEINHGDIENHSSFLCVGDRKRSTTCVGDSGAGLWRFRTKAARNGSVEAFHQIYGVVSFGEVTDEALCPFGPPSVFQRTSSNYEWIEEVVGLQNLA